MVKDEQKFEGAKLELKKIFICMHPECDAVLILNDKGLPTRRQTCGHLYEEENGSCYVFVLPIEQQLINLLKNGGIGLEEGKGHYSVLNSTCSLFILGKLSYVLKLYCRFI